MTTDLGTFGAVVDTGVAATLASPGWEEATVTIAGGAALAVTVRVDVDEQPTNGVQRRSGTILVPCAECPDEPTDGSTIVTVTETWTARTAVELSRYWHVQVWA